MQEDSDTLCTNLKVKQDPSTCESLAEVIFALAKSGWRYRNLSVYNISSRHRSLESGGLEYAKDLNPSNNHFRAVGTRMFWSIEVENDRYKHFIPKKSREGASLAIFWHNPLHDCESIWWILVWMFSVRLVQVPSQRWDQVKQWDHLHRSFPTTSRTTHRIDLFKLGEDLPELFASLESSMQQAYSCVSNVRFAVVDAFAEAEGELPHGAIKQSAWTQGGWLQKEMEDEVACLMKIDWPSVKEWSEETDTRGPES